MWGSIDFGTRQLWGEPSESIKGWCAALAADVWRAGGVAPGAAFELRCPVRVAHEHVAVFVVARKPGVRGAGCVGSNHIEAEDADENHADNRGGKKKGFPTGLKGNTLQVSLPALKTADVR